MLTTDRLRGAVLGWTLFLSVFTWTPTMRALLRPELSRWGLLGAEGRGASGVFWVLPALGLFALALFYLEGRGRLRPLVYTMLLMWHVPLTAGVVYWAIRAGNSATFEGGGWGVRIGFPMLAIPLLAFTTLAVIWIVSELRSRAPIPVGSWTDMQWGKLGIALALFPVAWLLFRAAGTQGFDWTAKLAIVINVIQWLLIVHAVNCPRVRAAHPRSSASLRNAPPSRLY